MIDFTTDAGKVRLLVGDLVETDFLFTDDQINGVIPLFPNLHIAAAHLVDLIASNEAMISKKIKTEDLATDGPAVADALRKHALALRTEGQRIIDDEDGAEIVDFQQAHPFWDLPVFGGYWGLGSSGFSSRFGDLWP
jgi:hypothetical protein